MPFFFANPAGFFAFLGIPLLLAIYFFQRQSKPFLAPTLFLLKNQFEHKSGGRQFKRFQPSWALLFQILALLLLTLLLADPRIRKSEVTQKVAIVIDSSASMSAFKKEILTETERVFHELDSSAFSIQVFQSLPESVALYSGTSPAEALSALKAWTPLTGMIDPSSALNLARSRIGQSGLLIYMSDHLPEGNLPSDAKLITVGRPINNVGFCGVSVKKKEGKDIAQVLVKNYGRFTEKRPYQLQSPSGEVILEKEVSLMPGQVKTLAFPFSEQRSALCFALAPDEFPIDDLAPVILPQRKALNVFFSDKDTEIKDLAERLSSISGMNPTDSVTNVDLVIQSAPSDSLRFPSANSLSFIASEKRVKALTSTIIPAESPLTRDLVWNSLIIPETSSFPVTTRDETILWAGERPLVSLRVTVQGSARFQHLICHFSVKGSNLETQANLAILFFRFVEQVREEKRAFFTDLAEVNQSLRSLSLPQSLSEESSISLTSALHYASSYKREVSSPSDLRALTLPPEPNIINIVQGEEKIVSYSTHFADTREADFSKAVTEDRSPLISDTERLQSTRPIPYSYLFILLLILLALAAWVVQHQPHLKGDDARLSSSS